MNRNLILLLVPIAILLFAISLSVGYAQSQSGKIYFVGVGPAGPELCTLQAIEIIKKVDVIYTPNYIRRLFAEYLVGKDVREAWSDSVIVVKGKSYTELQSQDMVDHTNELRAQAKKMTEDFKAEVAKGKSVALLINGDPCIYSDIRWFRPYLGADDFIVIPGMSSFNAGAALLKKELAPGGKGYRNAIILYSPLGEEFGVGPYTVDLAKHQTTIVFFMAAGRLKDIVGTLKKRYKSDTPVAMCYFIGYPDKQKVILGNLDNIVQKTAGEPEKELVLIYVGNFLNE